MSNARWYDLAIDAGMEVDTKRTTLPAGHMMVTHMFRLCGIERRVLVNATSDMDLQSESLNNASDELLTHVYSLTQ